MRMCPDLLAMLHSALIQTERGCAFVALCMGHVACVGATTPDRLSPAVVLLLASAGCCPCCCRAAATVTAAGQVKDSIPLRKAARNARQVQVACGMLPKVSCCNMPLARAESDPPAYLCFEVWTGPQHQLVARKLPNLPVPTTTGPCTAAAASTVTTSCRIILS